MGIELVKNKDSLTLGTQRVRAVEEVWIGEEAPIEDKGYKVWVNPDGDDVAQIAELATKEYVDEAIANIDIGEVDLSDYYNKSEVDSKIDAIELKEGPKGDKGDTPVKGTDYWTAADKTEIVNDVLSALPAAEGVSV